VYERSIEFLVYLDQFDLLTSLYCKRFCRFQLYKVVAILPLKDQLDVLDHSARSTINERDELIPQLGRSEIKLMTSTNSSHSLFYVKSC
jgi:hypothetical protein